MGAGTVREMDSDYSLFGSAHWMSHLWLQTQSNPLSYCLEGEKIVSWNYVLHIPNDTTLLVVITFYFLRVSHVYISGKVPMFTMARRVRWVGTEG